MKNSKEYNDKVGEQNVEQDSDHIDVNPRNPSRLNIDEPLAVGIENLEECEYDSYGNYSHVTTNDDCVFSLLYYFC